MKKKTPMIFNQLNRENVEAYTPKYAVDLIIPFLKKEWIIWAPFSLDEHHFAHYLRSKGFKIINTHISTGQDFLTYEPNFHFDIILDNPPFKGKTKFVERAIYFKKPFALFLPLGTFGDKGTPDAFLKNGLEPQMLIPIQRTEFHNQKENGISFKTVFICDKILNKQIIFVKMKKIKLLNEMKKKERIMKERKMKDKCDNCKKVAKIVFVNSLSDKGLCAKCMSG